MIPACRDCGAESEVLFPGTEPASFDDLFTVARGVEGFGYCMPHARAHGWPNQLPAEKRREARR